MRESKFRGYSDYHKMWYYGSIVKIHRRYYIYNTYGNRFEVIPESIGEYTGLKDKNGKEIYEGDVVSYWNGTLNMVMYETDIIYDNHFWIRSDKKVVPIIFEDGCFRLQRNNPLCSFLHGEEELEIIGNIHENPELLNA